METPGTLINRDFLITYLKHGTILSLLSFKWFSLDPTVVGNMWYRLIALYFFITCNHGTDGQQNFIIGGEPTYIQYHPHMVSLRPRWINAHVCAGSIVHKRWVLSAAHCTLMFKDEDLDAWIGTSFMDRDGKAYRSSQIVTHEEYDPTLYRNE